MHRMTKALVRQLFQDMTTWQRGSQRAPHKPLLLLYALARLQRGEPPQMRFREVEQPLRKLLLRFGPPRRVTHPEYPFCLLANDGLWTLRNAPPGLAAGEPPSVTQLRRSDTTGEFSREVRRVLYGDRRMIGELALDLLHLHFPESLHEDVLDAVGMSVENPRTFQPARDPLFRDRILRAYEYRCAVTGLDARLESATIAIEAAHIRWRTCGGPDTEPNGLAMNTLHHKLFDLGVFTITADCHRIAVSQYAVGNDVFRAMLINLHGKPIRPPAIAEHAPNAHFLRWHLSEVFRHPARPF